MAELHEQGALGLGMRVEFPQLGVEQVVEKERAVFGAVGGWHLRIKAASLLASSRETKVQPMAAA
ncbi:MAG: hypothetical protein R3E35_01150 [Rhodocyclaceae bacterium]